jgi:hypothetical protein
MTAPYRVEETPARAAADRSELEHRRCRKEARASVCVDGFRNYWNGRASTALEPTALTTAPLWRSRSLHVVDRRARRSSISLAKASGGRRLLLGDRRSAAATAPRDSASVELHGRRSLSAVRRGVWVLVAGAGDRGLQAGGWLWVARRRSVAAASWVGVSLDAGWDLGWGGPVATGPLATGPLTRSYSSVSAQARRGVCWIAPRRALAR